MKLGVGAMLLINSANADVESMVDDLVLLVGGVSLDASTDGGVQCRLRWMSGWAS